MCEVINPVTNHYSSSDLPIDGNCNRRIVVKKVVKKYAMAMLAAGLAVASTAVAGTSSDVSLVAPAFPGAGLTEPGPYSVTYLTNEPFSSVRAFYASHGIRLARDGNEDGTFSAVVMDPRAVCMAENATHRHAPSELANAPKGVTELPPDTAGVTVKVSVVPPRATNAIQLQMAEKESVFSHMAQQVVMQPGAGESQHTSAELLSLYNKNRWVETAFYPLHKTAHGAEPYDQWLIKTTAERIHHPVQVVQGKEKDMGKSMDAVGAQVQKLMAEGRTQEALKLAEKMQPAMDTMDAANSYVGKQITRDRWKTWTGVLEKLRAHGYRTKIVVSRKPGTWPMHNVCGI